MSEAVLYHSTPAGNRASILANGLLTEKDQTGMEAVFLSDTQSSGIDSDLWEVNVEGLPLDEDNTIPEVGNWYMCFEDIPTSRLTLIRQG